MEPAKKPARWLLLRGLAREARHWGRFTQLLSEKLTATVDTLDIVGVGTELGRAVPLTIPEITDDLRARYLALGREGEAGLLAISLGGMIAMDWCHRYPADFGRLVLINSSAGNLSPPHHRLKATMWGRVLKTAWSKQPVERELSILSMTTNLVAEPRPIAEAWARYSEEKPITRGVVARQLLAATRFRAPAKLDLPVLVLSSSADRFTSAECSERIARRFEARIERHPTGGHDLPLDDSAWIIDRLQNF
ncbi:MAG: alpha/beta fold hydrolase [Myxococcota bacterium]